MTFMGAWRPEICCGNGSVINPQVQFQAAQRTYVSIQLTCTEGNAGTQEMFLLERMTWGRLYKGDVWSCVDAKHVVAQASGAEGKISCDFEVVPGSVITLVLTSSNAGRARNDGRRRSSGQVYVPIGFEL